MTTCGKVIAQLQFTVAFKYTIRIPVISCLVFFFPQEYEKALKYIRTLLKNEPGNKQALDLEKLIDKALKKGKILLKLKLKCVKTEC